MIIRDLCLAETNTRTSETFRNAESDWVLQRESRLSNVIFGTSVYRPLPSGWDSVDGSHSERPSRDLESGRRKINSSLSSPMALSVWFQG